MPDTGMDRCIGEIQAAHGQGLSREDATSMMSMIDERAERLGRESGMSGPEAARQAAEEAAAAEKASALIEKRNALLNLQKRIGRRERIGDVADAVGKDGQPNLTHAVENQVTAKNAPAPGNRASAEATWKNMATNLQNQVVLGMEKAGLIKAFRNGSMDRDWAKELYELSMKAAGKDAHPGATGNAQALKMAEIIHGVQQLAKDRLNREGAWVGDYAGYITSTMHDADKIRRAGFEAWRDFIGPRLSAETFDGVDNREKMLRDTWHALVTGVHMSDREMVGMKDPAFTGPANAAKKASQGRVLHFNNADAWLDYQQRFGHGSLAEQTMGALDRSARQTALMQRWGTNPQAEFENDFRALGEKYRDSNPDAVIALNKARAGIETQFSYLTGEANRPVNALWAERMAGVRAVQSMAKLGGVALTHLSSFPTKAAELRYQGVGFLERYANSFQSLLRGRGAGEVREISDLLLAGMEGMHGSMLSRFNADDSAPGRISKMTNTFFKWSGLTYMLDAQKTGTQLVMSRLLGMNVDKEFGALSPEIQRNLQAYDISPAEWDVLRQAPDHATADGKTYLTPDAAMRANADAVMAAQGKVTLPQSARPLMSAAPKELTPSMVAAARDNLALKLHALYADTADRGIITPGIADKALLLHGTAPGSLAGEALRFIAQFKTWGVAAARQGLGREIYGGQGAAGAVSGIVQLALGAAVFGYATMTLKDMAAGKVPRAPNDPRTWGAALIQGGGFGILGDYMFGQTSRFGNSFVESLAGPTASTMGDIYKLVTLGRDEAMGDPNARAKDFGPDALRLVKGNTPFINLFYVRAALDYLMVHSLQESMNPGYLARSQRSMQRNTGQTYFLSPQDHLRTFGR
jgi:hypothetical protein